MARKNLVLALLPGLLLACAGPPSATNATPSNTASIPATNPCIVNGQTYCVLNSQVTQDTITDTICKPGWTSSIRPSRTYTDRLKVQVFDSLQLPGSLSDYEEDHRLPLELGGSPDNPKNLSPELGVSPNTKDHDETSLKDLVCSKDPQKRILLSTAQADLVIKWLKPWPQYKQ